MKITSLTMENLRKIGLLATAASLCLAADVFTHYFMKSIPIINLISLTMST